MRVVCICKSRRNIIQLNYKRIVERALHRSRQIGRHRPSYLAKSTRTHSLSLARSVYGTFSATNINDVQWEIFIVLFNSDDAFFLLAIFLPMQLFSLVIFCFQQTFFSLVCMNLCIFIFQYKHEADYGKKAPLNPYECNPIMMNTCKCAKFALKTMCNLRVFFASCCIKLNIFNCEYTL